MMKFFLGAIGSTSGEAAAVGRAWRILSSARVLAEVEE